MAKFSSANARARRSHAGARSRLGVGVYAQRAREQLQDETLNGQARCRIRYGQLAHDQTRKHLSLPAASMKDFIESGDNLAHGCQVIRCDLDDELPGAGATDHVRMRLERRLEQQVRSVARVFAGAEAL